MFPEIIKQPSAVSVSLNHDGSDGTGIQSVSPVPSASAADPSVPSVSNSRRKLTNWFANSRKHLTWETGYCQLLCCRPICVLYCMVFTC